jgi:hypothetical protein
MYFHEYVGVRGGYFTGMDVLAHIRNLIRA